MASVADDRGPISAINVTPFVDVVLVLLVILMVTSTSLVKASFGVDLPRAASAGDAVDRMLNVLIRADGALLLDGREVDERGLADGVKRALAANPEVRAVISADQNA